LRAMRTTSMSGSKIVSMVGAFLVKLRAD